MGRKEEKETSDTQKQVSQSTGKSSAEVGILPLEF